MARFTHLVLLSLSLLAIGPSLTAQEPGAGLVFTDVTAQAGVALPNTLTESVAWGDYDDDGDQDLYLTSDGPNNLFRNDGGDTFTDVTAAAGVGHAGFSVGAAFGDLDNDGDLDLYIVSFGSGSDVLYRNDGPIGPGGEHAFTDVTAAAGATEPSSSRGVAFIDYDRDGLLDVYVNAIGADILYHNLGNLRFTNVAGSLGVATAGQGVGVVATDLDGNGWIDLFTGNRSGDPNRLYLNDLGAFTDLTAPAGISEVGLGMGVLSFDYDNDLDFDLYWTSWPGTSGSPQPNALYENLGAGTRFAEVAAASGTTDALGWGISCNAADVDNDGWEDMFVTNGFDASSTANVLFLNQRDGTFDDVTPLLGGADFDGRGVAFADYDNDGDLDLCVTGGPSDDTRLWRNDTANGAGWITFNLVGRSSNRSAIGARVEVTTQLGTTVKEVSGGAGRGSQNSLPLEFGLGSADTVTEVTVRWPSGRVESLADPGMNQVVTLTEDGTVTDCPLNLGDPGFCEQCGPCDQGEGSCRSDDECVGRLVCAENFGALAGFAARREICVMRGSVPLPAYDATELPAVAGPNSVLDSLTPRGINNAGQVVGIAENGDPTDRRTSAFRFSTATGMEKLDRRGNDTSAAWAINEAGDVFGVLFAPGTTRRNAFFMYRDAGGYDLLRQGANNAIRQRFELDDMNEAGDLAGAVFSRSKNRYVPYVYTAEDGWMSLAGLDRRFREDSTRAFRINNRGEVLLVAEGSVATAAFVLWSGDRLAELGDFGGGFSLPGDLNDSGRVAGMARDGEGRLHAYVVRERGGPAVDLHPIAFTESRAVSVSAKGVVTGVLTAGVDYLFTWDPRRDRRLRVQVNGRELGRLLDDATFSEVSLIDVNERLEAVGRLLGITETGGTVERFFYFSPPFGLVDVQDVLSAAGSGREVAEVVAINDWGEILVRFEDEGRNGALVLHPRLEQPLAVSPRMPLRAAGH